MRPFNKNALYHHSWYHYDPDNATSVNHAFRDPGDNRLFNFIPICSNKPIKKDSRLHVLQEAHKGSFLDLSHCGLYIEPKNNYKYCAKCLALLPQAEVDVRLEILREMIPKAEMRRTEAIESVDRLYQDFIATMQRHIELNIK